LNGRGAVLLVGLLVGLVTPCASGDAPAPFDLTLLVDYGNNVVSQSLRDEVSAAVLDELHRAGCFRSVGLVRPDPGDDDDLVLDLTLLDVIDETTFEVSLAQRDSPMAPPETAQRQIARLRVSFRLALRTASDDVLLREKERRVERTYRPLTNEDPRYAARQETLDAVAEVLRGFACKGSPKSLQKAVARARGTPSPR